jgi:hypothetical protein
LGRQPDDLEHTFVELTEYEFNSLGFSHETFCLVLCEAERSKALRSLLELDQEFGRRLRQSTDKIIGAEVVPREINFETGQ